MEKVHKIIIGLLAATLCLVLILGFSTYNRLETQISNLEARILSLYSQLSNISYNMSSIKSDIQSAIEEEASIISSYSAVQSGLDENYCRDITFTVSPKQYTEETTAKLYIGGREYAMAKNGAVFSVTAALPVNEIYKSYSVAFETDGIVSVQKVQDYLSYNIENSYFHASYSGASSMTKNSITVNGRIWVYSDGENIPNGVRVYIADENGSVVWEKSGTEVIKEDFFELNKTFENAKFLYFNCEYTNADGFRFEECFYVMSIDGENGEIAVVDSPTVYYPNGTKLEWVYFD